MMLRRVALLLLLALTGCLYYHKWSRPGATEKDFYRDSMQCHQIAPHGGCSGAGWGSGCDTLARAQRAVVERCLRAEGWHPVGIVSMTGGTDDEYAP